MKANLFELLGRPVGIAASGRGTLVASSPETYDDEGVLPTIADCGTMVTFTTETYDDDSLLPSIEDCGTMITRSNLETYDDDSVLPST